MRKKTGKPGTKQPKPTRTLHFSEYFVPCQRRAGRKKAHKHKLFALVNVQMTLGQAAACPRVSRAKKVYVFASKHWKYKLFPLVNRWVVPGLSRLSKSLCVQSLCAFFLPKTRGRFDENGGNDEFAFYPPYPCDTPYRAMLFKAVLALPRMRVIPPPLYLVSHTEASVR